MKMAVIIPTMRPEGLRRLLKSMTEAQIPPGLELVIIVVNNQSDLGFRQLIYDVCGQSGLGVEYVLEPNQGQALAMNAGLTVARRYRCEWFYFCDDDETIHRELWSRFLLVCDANPGIGAFFGSYLPQVEIEYPFFMKQSERNMISIMSPVPSEAELLTSAYSCWGGNMFVSAAAFDRVGWQFNSTPHQSQDTDFAFRMLAASYKLLFVPDLIIYHEVNLQRCTMSYLQKRSFRAGHTTRYFDGVYQPPYQGRKLFGVPIYHYRKMFIVPWGEGLYALTRLWLNASYVLGYMLGK